MSIVKIAEAASVSVSTVSRYFNRPDSLSPQMVDKIRSAIEKVNYRPGIVRPGPKTENRVGIRNGAIAFLSLYDYPPEEMLRKPVMPLLIGSIQTELSNKQLSLFLGNVDKHGRLPDCISPKYCDGIIFFGRHSDSEIGAKLAKKLPDLPAVWCFREHIDADNHYDHVFYDNASVGPIAANYLAGRKHRQVAVFHTDLAHTAYRLRVETFMETAKRLGMKPTLFQAPAGKAFNINECFRGLAADFLRGGAKETGAFFCVDQDMLGIYIELLAAGFDARKLDMIGCNADEISLQFIHPRPATIDIKVTQIGKMAVDQLLRRINGDNGSTASEIFIKPELVPGGR